MSLTDEQALPMESDTMVAPNNTNPDNIVDQSLSSSSPSPETSPATSHSPSPSASETVLSESPPFEMVANGPIVDSEVMGAANDVLQPSQSLDGDALPRSQSPSGTPPPTEADKKKPKNDWVVDSIIGQRVEILNRYLPWALAFYRYLKATKAGAWTDEFEEGVALMMDLSEQVAREMDKLDSEGKRLQEMENLLDEYESQTKIERNRARTLVRGRAAKVDDLRLASLELDELNKVQNKIVSLRHQVDKSKIKYETEKSHLPRLKGLQRQYGRIFQLCGVEVCRIGDVD